MICSKCGNEPSGYHKMWGISWLAENRLASQAGLWSECFNTDVKVQLDNRVWPSRLNQGSYCQDVYNPITLRDKYHNRQGYFVAECTNVFLHSWNKLTHKIYDIMLYRTPSCLCVCTKLHVCTSKNTDILVTEFIYEKTDLFRIISTHITAEVYFGYVINYLKQTD